MSPEQINKSYRLTPNWKQFFWAYLLAVFTMPLAGIGIIYFYYLRKKQRRIRYVLTDHKIKIYNPPFEQHVDLVDIHHITLQRSWFEEKLGIGSLIIKSSTDDMILRGLKSPMQLKTLLEKAVEDKIHQQNQKQDSDPRKPDYKPGQMQQLEYLTGLWQQGLISEKDYQKERKNIT